MYTLYGFKGSGSAAIEMALPLTKEPFNIIEAATWEPNSALRQLEAVNPLKQIPTLVFPNGDVLTESAAILIHLGLTFPASGILPDDPGLRAQVIRGLVYISANCYSLIGVIDYPERLLAEADEMMQDRLRSGTRQRLHINWEIFANQFSGYDYLGGTEPNALDFLAVVVSQWSGTRAHLSKTHPDFLSLLQRVEAHPGVAPVIERHWKGVALSEEDDQQ
jgi:GST-like protein